LLLPILERDSPCFPRGAKSPQQGTDSDAPAPCRILSPTALQTLPQAVHGPGDLPSPSGSGFICWKYYRTSIGGYEKRKEYKWGYVKEKEN
jgi:hypothetical protein